MSSPAQVAVRPVFFYNDVRKVGETIGLVFFEPRYRLLVQKIANTHRQFVYLPNFVDYKTAYGDVGLIAQLTECERLPDGRVSVAATLTTNVLVVAHWIEPNSNGLHYARVLPLPRELPAQIDVVGCLEKLISPATPKMRVLPTRLGYLNVFAEPCNPHKDRHLATGRLHMNDEIDALEVRGDWVRHQAGWSVTKCQDMHFVVPCSTHLDTICSATGVTIKPIVGRTPNDFIVCRGTAQAVGQARDLLRQLRHDEHVFYEVIPDEPMVSATDLACEVMFTLRYEASHHGVTCEVAQTHAAQLLRGLRVVRINGMVVDSFVISVASFIDEASYRQLEREIPPSTDGLLEPSRRNECFCVVECAAPDTSVVTFAHLIHIPHSLAVEQIRQVKRVAHRDRIRLLLIGHYQSDCLFSLLPTDVLGLIVSQLLSFALPAC